MVTNAEIEELIVKLHKEGKGTREISKVVHKNFTYVGAVLKRRFPEEYVDNNPSLSKETQAIKMFSEKKTPTQVTIALNITPSECESYYANFWRLERQYELYQIYRDNKPGLREFIRFYKELKKRNVTTRKGFDEILEIVDNNNEINEELETMRKRMPQLLNSLNSTNDGVRVMSPEELESCFGSS